MPFYFRKSVSAGPFRFSFSPHGVGASVGVKGFRVGTGPRGHYVHAGRNGFYYRATIGRPAARTIAPTPVRRGRYPEPSSDGMYTITSGSVLGMQDSAFADVLHDINAKSRQLRLSVIFAAVAALLCTGVTVNLGAAASPVFLLIGAAAAFGAWLDSYKRATVVYYDEEALQVSFREICEAFDGLIACAGKWHVNAAEPVYDLTTWKRQAGASRLVTKKPATLEYRLPSVVKSNITPPSILTGMGRIYFLPDVVLIQQGGSFGAVGYSSLSMNSQVSNFIEEGWVPRDTEVLYHTWQHPNKGGGPDRRFRNNRQIPVCRYELLHLTSDSGLNELFEFSRFGSVGPFISAVRRIPRHSEPLALLSPSQERADAGVSDNHERALLPRWALFGTWAIALASIGLIVLGLARIQPAADAATPPVAPVHDAKTMFVSRQNLNCRLGRTTAERVVKTLHRGERVSVVDEQGGWSEIAGAESCWSLSSGLSITEERAVGRHRPRHAIRHRPDEGVLVNAIEPVIPPGDNLPPADSTSNGFKADSPEVLNQR